MMTMSKAISAGQALDYYQQEFTNAKDNYYSELEKLRDAGVAAWPTSGILKVN